MAVRIVVADVNQLIVITSPNLSTTVRCHWVDDSDSNSGGGEFQAVLTGPWPSANLTAFKAAMTAAIQSACFDAIGVTPAVTDIIMLDWIKGS